MTESIESVPAGSPLGRRARLFSEEEVKSINTPPTARKKSPIGINVPASKSSSSGGSSSSSSEKSQDLKTCGSMGDMRNLPKMSSTSFVRASPTSSTQPSTNLPLSPRGERKLSSSNLSNSNSNTAKISNSSTSSPEEKDTQDKSKERPENKAKDTNTSNPDSKAVPTNREANDTNAAAETKDGAESTKKKRKSGAGASSTPDVAKRSTAENEKKAKKPDSEKKKKGEKKATASATGPNLSKKDKEKKKEKEKESVAGSSKRDKDKDKESAPSSSKKEKESGGKEKDNGPSKKEKEKEKEKESPASSSNSKKEKEQPSVSISLPKKEKEKEVSIAKNEKESGGPTKKEKEPTMLPSPKKDLLTATVAPQSPRSKKVVSSSGLSVPASSSSRPKSMLFKDVELKAVEKYEGEDIKFDVGDRVCYVEMDENGWVRGTCKGKDGWFPRSAVVHLGKQNPFAKFDQKDKLKEKETLENSSILMNKDETKKILDKFLGGRAATQPAPDDDSEEKKIQKKKTRALLKGIFGSKPKDKKLTTIFNSSLQELKAYSVEGHEIPLILIDCANYYEKIDVNKIEGIFRQSGVQTEVEKIKAMYTDSDVSVDLSTIVDDPHVVGGLMKQFLGSLTEPVIPFNLYDIFIKSYNQYAEKYTKEKTIAKKVAELLTQLPPINYNTLCFLVKFLANIAKHEASTKMGAMNLGTVFGPNVMRPAISTTDSLLDTSNAKIVDLLIRFHNLVFPEKK